MAFLDNVAFGLLAINGQLQHLIKKAAVCTSGQAQPRDKAGQFATCGAGSPNDLGRNLLKTGGYSYQPIGDNSPKSGYMVSIAREEGGEAVFDFPKSRTAVKKSDWRKLKVQIEDHLKKNWKQFKNKDLYAGGWWDKKSGKIYLDVSENIQDRTKAIKVAKDRAQEGVFDLQTFKTISKEQYDE